MNNLHTHKKIATARLSLYSNTLLIVLKVVAGIYTGSVSIISEAIHSALDLVAAIIAFFAVRISDKPADTEHPFGHGKYENISGVIEALLIFAAAIWIIFEALDKLLHKGHLVSTNALSLGIIVMFISGIINFFVSRRLYKVAKQTDSIALEADALHLKTDVYTSLGVGFGLLLIELTGYHFLDPIIALLVAVFIISEAYQMLIKSVNPLLDSSLNIDELTMVENALKNNINNNCTYSELKTRKSGAIYFIQFRLQIPLNTTLSNAVKLRNKLELNIKKSIKQCDLIIQLDVRLN